MTQQDPLAFAAVVLRDRGCKPATDMAQAAGLSRSYWSDVEHGRRLPSWDTALRMLRAVEGVPQDWTVAWARDKLGPAFHDLAAILEIRALAPEAVDLGAAHPDCGDRCPCFERGERVESDANNPWA